MTTIHTHVHNTPNAEDNSTSTGLILGILLAIIIGLLIVLFGLPYLRNRGTGESQTAPQQTSYGVSGALNVGSQ